MSRLLALVLLVALVLGAPPAGAAPAPDLFTVGPVRVDAAAESALAARDVAMAQGRPQAFAQLFRRLTATGNWGRQPELGDEALLRLIRAFQVANERRSTTRYLADVTYHFNPAAVRALLRQTGIPFTETRSRPALVIPLTAGQPGFDPNSPWAMAWSSPALQLGVVPFVLPQAGDLDGMELFTNPDLPRMDWAALEPLARQYGAEEVVVALASANANTVQMVEVTPTTRGAFTFAYAQSSFEADAQAVADRAYESYKTRSSVDFNARGTLSADVRFESLEDWARIRSQLGAVRSVANIDVIGLALTEAEIELTYFGRPEQLRDALAQEDLNLTTAGGQYTLELSRRAAASSFR